VPIINIKFIEGVVATPEQKLELVQRMTDTFVDILGDVVRPFTYCIIDETPPMQWGIAGVPMPDLAYLVSDEHAAVIDDVNDVQRLAVPAVLTHILEHLADGPTLVDRDVVHRHQMSDDASRVFEQRRRFGAFVGCEL